MTRSRFRPTRDNWFWPICSQPFTTRLSVLVFYAVGLSQMTITNPISNVRFFFHQYFTVFFPDVFSGAVFACVYRLLKENPDNQLKGIFACGLDDENWIGIKNRNNPSERKCYEKAANIYDKILQYIRGFARYDERVRQERRKQRESTSSKKVH